jgi:hypothetical protein
VGRSESLGSRPRLSGAETPSDGRCFDYRTLGKWEWTRYGGSRMRVRLGLAACGVGIFFLRRRESNRYLCIYVDDVKPCSGPASGCPNHNIIVSYNTLMDTYTNYMLKCK